MRSTSLSAVAAFAVAQVAGHATFQQLWVNGVDMGSQCVRPPVSNNPVEDVTSNNMRCNVGGTAAAGSKCPVKAGDSVTVEMHQHDSRGCGGEEAIGGDHHGPLMVYMSKVDDAQTADGSGGWFKIFQDSWAKNPSGANGDADFWGTKDMNECCGLTEIKIPTDIPDGDYLLRAEVIALHVASANKGAQLYMSCYQITVSGGTGSSVPSTVKFPGAYSASDPGILVNIHQPMQSYIAPGPSVVSGGTTKEAGSGCSGCEATCTAGSGPSTTLGTSQPTGGSGGDGGSGGCTSGAWEQCGGQDWTGCTTCQSGYTCKAQGNYYSQCSPS